MFVNVCKWEKEEVQFVVRVIKILLLFSENNFLSLFFLG